MSEKTAHSKRLVAACEELLAASGVEQSSAREKKISEDLVAFKESFDNKMNTANQNINQLKVTIEESLDVKTNTLDQHMKQLSSDVMKLAKDTKMQTLAWAISNCELNCFTYYDSGYQKSSAQLIRNILFSFRKEFGHYLPGEAMLKQVLPYQATDAERLKAKEDFRERISKQIHELTGTEPRILLSEKRYCIYYS